MTAQERSILEGLANETLSQAMRLGCDDISVICANSKDSQVRFANNSITLVNNIQDLAIWMYVSKQKRRIVGVSYNPTSAGVEKFVSNLVKSCEALPETPDYVPLPRGPFSYSGHANFDPKVEDAPLVDYVKQTIDRALRAGAARVAGSLNTESTDVLILTSAGATGKDKESQILLNVRAFADDNASGHGLSCSSYVSDFHPEAAGERAGDFAKRSLNPKQIPDGIYDVIFSPAVIANILPVASSASAFAIESGNSFLTDKLGQDVSVSSLSIEDYGVYDQGLGGSIFDEEGTPTQRNRILTNGRFTTMLHNCTTAKKFGVKSTGSAGLISPGPNTIIFSQGDRTLNEIIEETKRGLMITNNWYTRYQNPRTGEYSTVPRDAAFIVESGEVTEPVSGLRVSDSIPRQLMNIDAISKEREWVRWWEVATPTLAPSMRIKGVHITRAVGS